MTKMSDTQRYTVLSFNDAQANRGLLTAWRHSTIRALVHAGYAFYPANLSPRAATNANLRTAYVTSQGLRAAGYDLDGLHADAIAEDERRSQCGCTRNPLGHSRAEHPTSV